MLRDKDVYNPNKLFHYKEYLGKVARGEPVPPVNIQVDITNGCNNSCIWCFYDNFPLDEFSRKDKIEKEKMFEVLRDLSEMGCKSVEWEGGGEPTVYKEYVEVVSEARRLGLNQALVTNGKNLSKGIASACYDFDWVRVSLNAATRKTYELEHRRDSFQLVVDNLKDFIANKEDKCVVGVSMVVDENNWREVVDMTKLAKDIGADNVRIAFPNTAKGVSIFDGILSDLKEQLRKADAIQDDNFKVFTFSDRIDTLALRTKSKRCYHHHLTPSLGANGVIYPCCFFKYLPEYNLGDINETSFKDAWYGDRRKQFTDTIGEDCKQSCWFNGKNTLADYIILEPEDVPHLDYP